MSWLHPALVLVAAAALIPVLPGRLRRAWLVLAPLLGLVNLWLLPVGASWQVTLFDSYHLTLLRLDPLSFPFAVVFHLALFVGTVFALHVDDLREHLSAYVYAAGAIGGVLAGDLLSLFVWWEVVAIAPVPLIWVRGTPRAFAAGQRYLLVQVISGLVLLAGVLVHVAQGGSLHFDHLGLDGSALSWGRRGLGSQLILLACGIKCAWPLLHTWITDAYPEATASGAVFLSAFTSKLAVYALARGFAGTEDLVLIGAAMAAFPIFYAVIENDLRRVLAYSLINQVGFMVVGIGIGTPMGINGAVAHAFADVLFKGLLFMSMGAVLYRTGRINASELGGLYKSMPFTTACCLVGAASISAFPLFSAFATKSMVMEAAAQEHHTVVWLVLLFAAAGVFHHAGIKIPFFAFFAHDAKLRPAEAPWNMRIAMGIAALLSIGIGCFPGALYAILPHPTDYVPYTAPHVVTQLQVLFFSALAFATLMLTGLYPPELRSTNLDADWLWRRAGGLFWKALVGPLALVARLFERLVLEWLPRGCVAAFMGHGAAGSLLARQWALGSSVMALLLLLIAYLVLSARTGL